MGVCTPLGVYEHTGGIQMYGAYKHRGIQIPLPSIKNMATTKKSRKNSYLKLNSYT